MSVGPLACDLMGWRGASGGGAANTPAFLFFGGVLMLLGGILEYIRRNTFPAVVFSSFGAFWLTFGATLMPQFNAYAAYAPTGAAAVEGLKTKGFNASFGFFALSMMILCFVYMICAIRTNLVFLLMFVTLTLVFGFVTAAYFVLASNYAGNAKLAGNFLVTAGACAFTTTAIGWYTFLSMMFQSVDFPIVLPVGDFSKTTKRQSEPASSKV
ncbi:GPR1/FUN34/yaaH family-domain-containing protein [Pseudomassariella vexata]|uniref:GPR1/FUN34/yaaH family-domain-containing protein n=1 Tax=Pseudomassariella vexata TaxID=1141098 RepID=A0A1Y2DTL1_9PEZI|nr:GPR1/FUN34/yaaH family-domain-containing protein [Pseudomassariella vexata]ORY62587.1 GPR1/FUN34/yaaH family-domain-containing protein [Pseudomassariella vexata]